MVLVHTRNALHSLAEHVLAPSRQQIDGRIGLQPTTQGFGTPVLAAPTGPRQVMVQRDRLVDRVGPTERVQRVTTLGAAAAFIGLELGATEAPYELATPLDPDAPLAIDADAAATIAAWFALAHDALRAVVADQADHGPSAIQLWPEHFDLATTIDRVNLGASPGDAAHDEPYLYVGPFEPRSGPFWNETFGASLTRAQVSDVSVAVEFLTTGLVLSR